MTYKQAQELGGQVRKGEKSASVVCAKTFTKSEEAENGDQIEKVIPFLKSYAVFNADQIDGLDARYYAKAEPRERVIDRISEVDAFFSRLGADIRNGGARAYYRGDSDFVQMPDFEAFDDATSYYATLAHEITHWTKHLTRLDRDFGRKSWGDEGYAMEELVAELGAAFLCADLGLQSEPREDHASYIESWLKVLKDDKRAIFTAASHASRAVDFINQKATAQQLAA
jgi:antirestriction protein ArdC